VHHDGDCRPNCNYNNDYRKNFPHIDPLRGFSGRLDEFWQPLRLIFFANFAVKSFTLCSPGREKLLTTKDAKNIRKEREEKTN
jgi:hypothetical protein